jgi:hypothetical protein
MTKLEELQTDLEIHEESLVRLRDPDFNSKAHRGRIHNPVYDMNPNVIIPSYVKIIKSIKEEIATLKGKKKAKK